VEFIRGIKYTPSICIKITSVGIRLK
jgi:hypothetical protein